MYATSSLPHVIDKHDGVDAASTTNNSDYAINRFSQKYDSYQEFLYRSQQQLYQRQQQQQQRRRLSSTGDGSADSSTTTSGSSYGGEQEDGSEESRAGESDRDDRTTLMKTTTAMKNDDSNGQISELERQQFEIFFKGLKTQVFVCSTLANLYVKTATDTDWQLKYTGIPVVILDVGETRARNKRRIQITLAERGTCFTLWHDTIDNLSAYQVAGKAFHTMHLSSDHTVQIGLSFDTCQAAFDMWTHIERLVACPENISLSIPGKKKKKKEQKRQSKPAPLPPKSHISQPCCFQHITSVDRDDTNRFYSLKEFLPSNLKGRTLDDEVV